MAYTPELSRESSAVLRRIAWSLGLPMTKTLEEILRFIPSCMDRYRVCNACRDSSICEQCTFNAKGGTSEPHKPDSTGNNIP